MSQDFGAALLARLGEGCETQFFSWKRLCRAKPGNRIYVHRYTEPISLSPRASGERGAERGARRSRLALAQIAWRQTVF